MKFKIAGNYNGDPETLAQRHVEGAVQFKEFEDLKQFAIIMNVFALVVLLLMEVLGWLRSGEILTDFWGAILAMVCMVPHEFLHAVCFRGEVKMYNNLKQGMLFVLGTEDMSKAQYVFMSMLPNLVFGFIPFLIFMIFPHMTMLGTMGALGICAGAGDYVNVYNCLTQVPKGAVVFSSGIHTFWYQPNH